ncbi:hypothetical protein FRB95_012419 [Tulasnella sp. JGI-2019a]|nr:hypothetical protein FRB95_012419 [Tulasnella sp. JGI-2019a]
MSSSQIAPAVQEKYAEHAALIARLATTDYIPSAYQSNVARIDQLTKEIATKKERVKHLAEKTKAEYNDVQELQRSASKRLFLRLKEGKEGLNKRKMKEETEYLDAFQAEKNEQMSIGTLEKELDVAQKANFDLKKRAESLEQARKRLDELYQDLFGGLTTEYPQEDAAEEAVRNAEVPYTEAQERLNRESQVTALLTKAEKAMKKVLHYMTEAEQIGLREIASAAHEVNFYEMRELKSAKRHAMDVETYVGEARGFENDVHDIGWLSIPLQDEKSRSKGNDELQIYQLITNSTKDCVRYATRLEGEVHRSKQRLSDLSKLAENRSSMLMAKRAELEKIRRKIIEEVHHGILPPAPAQEPWMPMLPSSMLESMGATNESRTPTRFPSVDTSSLSSTIRSKPPNYPVGGFRSREGSVQGIEVSGPTLPDGSAGMAFPNTPEFSFPADTSGSTYTNVSMPIGPTVPGFRGAGFMGGTGSIEAPPRSMPHGGVPWALNPYAAWTLWNAGNDTIASNGDVLTMPEAGDPQSPRSMPLPAPDSDEPHLGSHGQVEAISGSIDAEETVVVKGVGKLFDFKRDAVPVAWEEVAAGEIRLVINNPTQMVRIVAFSDGSYSTKAEYDIEVGAQLASSCGVGSDRSWVIRLSKTRSIAVRFATPEAAHAFKQAFDQREVSMPEAPAPSLAPVVMPSGPSNEGQHLPARSTLQSSPQFASDVTSSPISTLFSPTDVPTSTLPSSTSPKAPPPTPSATLPRQSTSVQPPAPSWPAGPGAKADPST